MCFFGKDVAVHFFILDMLLAASSAAGGIVGYVLHLSWYVNTAQLQCSLLWLWNNKAEFTLNIKLWWTKCKFTLNTIFFLLLFSSYTRYTTNYPGCHTLLQSWRESIKLSLGNTFGVQGLGAFSTLGLQTTAGALVLIGDITYSQYYLLQQLNKRMCPN